jgi:hypothetical protein
MSSGDGCCGGPMEVEMKADDAQGCGEGCGCGPGFNTVETATIQGFLSGLYASTLPREKLAEYLAAMADQEGSDFARPAQFLAGALESLGTDSPKPVGVQLLELVSGEEV